MNLFCLGFFKWINWLDSLFLYMHVGLFNLSIAMERCACIWEEKAKSNCFWLGLSDGVGMQDWLLSCLTTIVCDGRPLLYYYFWALPILNRQKFLAICHFCAYSSLLSTYSIIKVQLKASFLKECVLTCRWKFKIFCMTVLVCFAISSSISFTVLSPVRWFIRWSKSCNTTAIFWYFKQTFTVQIFFLQIWLSNYKKKSD